MTNKEALQSVVDGLQFADNTLVKVLTDRDVSATATYSADDARDIDLCAVELLYATCTQARVSEGGFSYTPADLESIKARLLYLAKKHNLTDILNQFTRTVKDASSKW